MKLPQKIEALRRATIFNKETRKFALNELKKDKSYLSKCLREDLRENSIFRNYEDYLVSVVLERDGVMERLKPISFGRVFNSKEFLKLYLQDFKSVPLEFRVRKVGVFDTETTDIFGYILSYAFVIEDLSEFKVQKEVYELLNPKAKIKKEAYEVHKISEDMVKNKPTFIEKKEEILGLFDEVDMVVGHNVFFDFGILKRELERAKHFPNIIEVPIFDTMFYSWDIVVLDKKKQPRLEEAVAFFLGNKQVNYHNALEDVKMTLQVFNKLIQDGEKFS